VIRLPKVSPSLAGPVARNAMAARIDKLPPRLAPRGLTIAQAAAFAGVSEGSFNTARARGDYPNPTLAGGRIDLKLLERAMDRLSGLLVEDDVMDPLADWETKHGARHA
jgi:hypothetical protein